MLTVEPPDYYPIVDKLFVGKLVEGLEPFGLQIKEVRVRVFPSDGTISLDFLLKVERDSGIPIATIQAFVEGILEKLCNEATSTFGRLYRLRFSVKSVSIVQETRTRKATPKYSLVVDAPEEVVPIVRRVGKGLLIRLKEWGVPVSALTLSMDSKLKRVGIVVKVMKELTVYEKEDLSRSIAEKTSAFMKALLHSSPEIQVKVLDPRDRALSIVLKRMEDMVKEAEELAEREDIQALMEALGKSPSP